LKRNDLKKIGQPTWISPELATLIKEPFSDPDWIFEKKFDGVRCIVVRRDGKVTLYSRNKKKMNQSYPELIKPFLSQKRKQFIIDGEIVTDQGKLGSFSKLQERMHRLDPKEKLKRIPVVMYVFDLLYLDGYDLRKSPLLQRKKVLEKAFSFKAKIHFTEHVIKQGESFFSKVCKKGWEGVVAKKKDSEYQSKRTRQWLKIKGFNRQELIIVGYTDPAGSRVGFGSLLLGYYDKGKLCYAGKVGTGFDRKFLQMLSQKLKKLERKKSSLGVNIKEKGAHFVRPTLVCEIAFTEWTSDGKLRHPSFLGLRKDKSAKKVVRERGKRR
jgi:bifunctional non-homologous end joining protein LigD